MIRKINKVKKGLILNEALAIAKEKGGKCHGFEEGENNSVTLSRKKLLFECRKGHRFQRNYGNMIETNTFCLKCKNIKLKILKFKKLHELADRFGGKCLSKEYTNSHKKYQWKCKKGHRFRRTYHAIKRKNKFCPECTKLSHNS